MNILKIFVSTKGSRLRCISSPVEAAMQSGFNDYLFLNQMKVKLTTLPQHEHTHTHSCAPPTHRKSIFGRMFYNETSLNWQTTQRQKTLTLSFSKSLSLSSPLLPVSLAFSHVHTTHIHTLPLWPADTQPVTPPPRERLTWEFDSPEAQPIPAGANSGIISIITEFLCLFPSVYTSFYLLLFSSDGFITANIPISNTVSFFLLFCSKH